MVVLDLKLLQSILKETSMCVANFIATQKQNTTHTPA